MKILVTGVVELMRTGKNYSLNEVADLFVERFGCETVYLPYQNENYRVVLRKTTDTIDRLGWNPTDKLVEYIKNL
jgi:hypothetical protein